MSKTYVTILGKAIQSVAKLRGGGSALPGLVVERIDPHFIKDTLAHLPRGVVVISGTNGKTTTTKMVVELLESQELKVFTNKSGSNFTRGVAAALLSEVDMRGHLHADIAVLELDEAHAVHFVKVIPPRISLILNVMRDQLDRFGEIDVTAKLLQTIVSATTESVVLNREDPRIARLETGSKHVTYFGLSPELRATFPSDDSLHGGSDATSRVAADVTLTAYAGSSATFRIDDESVTTPLLLGGVYNVFNAAAALALARVVMGEKADSKKLVQALAHITPAFGRGETITVNGQPVELILVKNPSGFRLSLQSYDPSGYATMIAVSDNYADGRDMSWLWDVSFESLVSGGVQVVSGIRAYDMALRLQYDEVPFTDVLPSIHEAVTSLVASSSDQPKRIYCTYTAMLAIRRELGKLTKVEAIG